MPMVNFYPRDIFLSKVAGLWFQERVLPVGLFTLRHSRRSLEATKKKRQACFDPHSYFSLITLAISSMLHCHTSEIRFHN